jgi:hypothetical protein
MNKFKKPFVRNRIRLTGVALDAQFRRGISRTSKIGRSQQRPNISGNAKTLAILPMVGRNRNGSYDPVQIDTGKRNVIEQEGREARAE